VARGWNLIAVEAEGLTDWGRTSADLVRLRFDGAGRLLREKSAVRGRGRLRTAVVAPDGSLLVTTDNGGGRDVVLRVRPGR
jgi:glucose/arabinose dehydrogenase